MRLKTKTTAIAAAVSMAIVGTTANAGPLAKYEVWASDQSNSVAGETGTSLKGSYLWIWRSKDVDKHVKTNAPLNPLKCDGTNNQNSLGEPCDMLDVFPQDLAEHDGSGLTGETLADLPAFGKLHGALPDPQNLYVNINMFTTTGGFVGIMDGRTKEAVALFRVSQTTAPSGGGRSVHMSFWGPNGEYLYVANLHGRILERIDITRDGSGNITNANFNRDASLGVGKDMGILDDATAFQGNNAQGNPLVSTVSGGTAGAGMDLGDLTPNGYCRENGCDSNDTQAPGTDDAPLGGRGANVIVCPIVSDDNNVYITFGGGGLLVADGTTSPMSIIAEYDANVLNGAGCGGVQVGSRMWLNAGASAAASGATQSTFTMYTIDDHYFQIGSNPKPPNFPTVNTVYKDLTDTDGNGANTATIGALSGPASNNTGQLPGTATRRDAHGMARTLDGAYIHNVDRIQNVMEVFTTTPGSETRVGTYDLTSEDGQGNGVGACDADSVTDDLALPGNDPAGDLMQAGAGGKYMFIALRGPAPGSVKHAAQGSCPGVGVIKLKPNGSSGKLAGVIRTTNTVDDAPTGTITGGHQYLGAERSDPHGVSVRCNVEKANHNCTNF